MAVPVPIKPLDTVAVHFPIRGNNHGNIKQKTGAFVSRQRSPSTRNQPTKSIREKLFPNHRGNDPQQQSYKGS